MACSLIKRLSNPATAILGLAACVLVGSLDTAQVNAQYWGPTYRSSTATEANRRGLGALIRDQGESNLLNAQAAGAFEEARSKYIENSVDAVQAYYDRKRVREEYMVAKKQKADESRKHFLERRGGLPELSNQDVNVSTGEVNWPPLLVIKDYDPFRSEYDAIIQSYYTNGMLQSNQFMKSQSVSRNWRKQIGTDRKKYGVEQARSGIRFIIALDKLMAGS